MSGCKVFILFLILFTGFTHGKTSRKYHNIEDIISNGRRFNGGIQSSTSHNTTDGHLKKRGRSLSLPWPWDTSPPSNKPSSLMPMPTPQPRNAITSIPTPTKMPAKRITHNPSSMPTRSSTETPTMFPLSQRTDKPSKTPSKSLSAAGVVVPRSSVTNPPTPTPKPGSGILIVSVAVIASSAAIITALLAFVACQKNKEKKGSSNHETVHNRSNDEEVLSADKDIVFVQVEQAQDEVSSLGGIDAWSLSPTFFTEHWKRSHWPDYETSIGGKEKVLDNVRS